MELNSKSVIGIVGSGAMGSGIAQVAAMAGYQVLLYDNNAPSLQKAKACCNNFKTASNISSAFCSFQPGLGSIGFVDD